MTAEGPAHPEAQRLLVWAGPRVRSKRAALELISRGSIAFEPSEALVDLAKRVEGRTDAAVDEELSDPRRFLVVAVDPARTAQARAWLARECHDRRLTVFDPLGERLMVGSVPSAHQVSSPVRKLREALASNPDVLNDATKLKEAAFNAVGGVSAFDALLPRATAVPFNVPTPLRFLVPDAVPPKKQSRASLRRYLTDLESSSDQARRNAAFDLAGWSPSTAVDDALVASLTRETDIYLRAVLLLALALRGAMEVAEVLRFANDIAAAATTGNNHHSGLAATIAAFTALIAGYRARTPVDRAGVRDLVAAAACFPSERERASALAALLSEFP